ncbi:MAG: sigma factor [Mycobacteriales bacterium]
MGSWSMAEELMATTFLEAWRCRRSMPAAADGVLPWLLAVANNVMRNTRRSRRRYAAGPGPRRSSAAPARRARPTLLPGSKRRGHC